LQGFFYFLGERLFSLSTPGIAKISFMGKEILRPYATFSHPNSLAGFYLLLYFYFLTQKKINQFLFLKYFLLFLSSAMILFSFSKIAIFTFLMLNSIYIWQNFKKCSLCQISRIFIFLILAIVFFQGKGDVLTVEKRILLIKNAFLILEKTPFFGVGLGNYLIAQNKISSSIYLFFNQPVHNIFLLSLVELGIIGWFVLIYFLVKKSKKIITANYYLLTTILITGFFDHYWLTLPQNFFLLAVIFALN
ncbi:MAG: O-antigen ligase family protein, partial [Microgenomates group bacterium]